MFYATTCVGLRYGPLQNMLSGFSWKYVSRRCPLARGRAVLSPFTSETGFAWLLLQLRALTHYSVSARAFHCSVSTSLLKRVTECLPFVHRIRFTLFLRSRLTLIRLALIRNPWSFGGRGSRPPYRYLYLHLLFRDLQRHSHAFFCDYRNAPLPISIAKYSTTSAPDLCPIIIHAGSLD